VNVHALPTVAVVGGVPLILGAVALAGAAKSIEMAMSASAPENGARSA
jgi:hypothetical protein